MENFENLLKKYAHLLLKRGLNVQEGQILLINAEVEQVAFTRMLVAEAYAQGAGHVVVQWSDQAIQKEELIHADEKFLTEIPDYIIARMNYQIEHRVSRLALRSIDPDGLAGVPEDRMALSVRAANQALAPMREATQSNKVSWLVAAAAGQAWAEKVFPDLSPEAALEALWDQIFKTCRVYEEDPIQAWIEHEEKLESKAAILNAEQFTALHYQAPGTDLVLGMPENHHWESAGSRNEAGDYFLANMPTEEVFSAPDYRRADGYVTSTKPLSYNGTIIEGIKVHFQDGLITKVEASRGQETLEKLVFENRGARSLGEVALVPHQSPISQSGIIFYNTLFDENASNHLAIGSAYAFSVEGGTEMTVEERQAAGLNQSDVHVDFMIGSGQMDIDGIRPDGSRVPIFRQGEWAI